MVIDALGGNRMTYADLLTKAGEFKALWIVGGYPRRDWATEELQAVADATEFLVVQDIFPSVLTQRADLVLPSCAWVEREGSFANHAGVIQPFERAINPPEGAQRDGQYLYQMAGHSGLYTGARVREMMSKTMPAFAKPHVAPPAPEYAH